MKQACAFTCCLVFLGVASCGKETPPPRPADFGILIESTSGERIDTFEGVVTKDLVGARDTTIELAFTVAELDTLHRAVWTAGLFEVPTPHPSIDLRGGMASDFATHVRIQSGGRTREFFWEHKHAPAPSAAREWQRLNSVIRCARRMVERHPDYLALPMQQGAYL